MIVVAIVAILSAIAIPSLTTNREIAFDKQRKNNISLVKAAKERWAMDYSKTTGTPSFGDLNTYLPLIDSKKDLEVAGDPISINAIGTDPSY